MSKYDDVYFVADNQAINRVRVGSSKTRNRGAFSSSLAALNIIKEGFIQSKFDTNPLMRLSPRRKSPETDMGQYSKSASQGIPKVGGMPV